MPQISFSMSQSDYSCWINLNSGERFQRKVFLGFDFFLGGGGGRVTAMFLMDNF